ncbi:MAG TPA: CCA tRNA nucleotidyltransferase [Streptosporangiaceae bacterium]|nr:CCA tRNA nucleotidyltransferase [Streptosporangiaceae bacterium]
MAVPNSTSPPLVSSVNPLNDDQRQAAAALLRRVSPIADDLGRRFAGHGYELALVGGPVRDVFLGREPGDLDLTTNAPPSDILRIVDQWADSVWTVGIDFGTVGLRKNGMILEVTTYRSEEYVPRSRKPTVHYGTSLEGDLRRRDFTVNAMAARLPGHELVDPFGGLAALKEKVLRTPGSPDESFSDDALRILRAARFAAKLDFAVADEVREAMTRHAGQLREDVSVERITDELSKLMLTPDPVRGIDLLVQTGVADLVLPEVPQLRLEADEHYRHKDVYQHSLTVLRQAIELEERYGLSNDLVLRLAALLHDIGKPRTRSKLPDGRVAFHHHEVVGAKLARKRLTALRFPKDVVTDVAELVQLHLRFHGYGDAEWTDSAVRRYVRDAGPLLTRLNALTRADCTTRNKAKADRLARAYDDLEERIARLSQEEELARLRPELNGNDIMRILSIPGGPLVGEAYNFLLELRIEQGLIGRERATQELLRWAEAEGLSGPPEGPGGPDGSAGPGAAENGPAAGS